MCKMGNVINLNQYRKKREREQKNRQTAANRVKYGRVKAGSRGLAKHRENEEKELAQKTSEPIPLHVNQPHPAETETGEDTEPG